MRFIKDFTNPHRMVRWGGGGTSESGGTPTVTTGTTVAPVPTGGGSFMPSSGGDQPSSKGNVSGATASGAPQARQSAAAPQFQQTTGTQTGGLPNSNDVARSRYGAAVDQSIAGSSVGNNNSKYTYVAPIAPLAPVSPTPTPVAPTPVTAAPKPVTAAPDPVATAPLAPVVTNPNVGADGSTGSADKISGPGPDKMDPPVRRPRPTEEDNITAAYQDGRRSPSYTSPDKQASMDKAAKAKAAATAKIRAAEKAQAARVKSAARDKAAKAKAAATAKIRAAEKAKAAKAKLDANRKSSYEQYASLRKPTKTSKYKHGGGR